MGDLTKNFDRKEFVCKCGCGFDMIDINLVNKLQLVRDNYGKPLKISSGCRCSNYNKKVGGVKGSEHITGEAVDIECLDGRNRHELIPILIGIFKRVGIAKTFIHIGISESKPQNVIWTY